MLNEYFKMLFDVAIGSRRSPDDYSRSRGAARREVFCRRQDAGAIDVDID